METLNRPQILVGRENLRPVIYEQFNEAHLISLQSPWSHFEIAMGKDIADWLNITEQERKVIAGILKGFTLIETGVGCYWRNIVAKNFPHPEIAMMATTFSHHETIHARAYDHLESTLGLDTYEAFKQDAVACKKLNDILDYLNSTNIAASLAIFSGAVEGVSLFSSFAILLSFAQRGEFKGMGQILSWSQLEESYHSNMGIKLYEQLIKEAPELKPEDSVIIEGFESVVENEISFITGVFADGDLQTITKSQAIDYVHFRANSKLMELKIKPIYELNGDYRIVKHFFENISKGKTMNDFFARSRSGTGYNAILTQDFLGSRFSRPS